MLFFKKKFKRLEDEAKKEDETAEPSEEKHDQPLNMGGASDSLLSAEITKLKVQFEQFAELRRVNNERFTRINEQVGELRGMIMDTNRSMQEMEIKVIKAVDLVEAVQPDKLMVEVRKQDAKIEALKADIESKEAMMKTIMDGLKEIRGQIAVFKGVDQVVKLNEEVKNELANIKKIQATVERHSDKIEGIFIESQKRFQDFEKIGERITEMDKSLKQVISQSDETRVKIPVLASKKEMEDLITKLNNFEKHVGNVIDLLTKRANELPKETNDRFKRLEESLNKTLKRRTGQTIASSTEINATEISDKEVKADVKDGEKAVAGAAQAPSQSQPAVTPPVIKAEKQDQKKTGLFGGMFRKKVDEKKEVTKTLKDLGYKQ